jgi:hypothetical protein
MAMAKVGGWNDTNRETGKWLELKRRCSVGYDLVGMCERLRWSCLSVQGPRGTCPRSAGLCFLEIGLKIQYSPVDHF